MVVSSNPDDECGGHTTFNGATRQIPGTQQSRMPIPDLAAEPRWMKLATTAPCPAGCALLRDVRAWHGGTPNLSAEVRAIPMAAFVAPWINPDVFGSSATGNGVALLPRSVYEGLSEDGKRIGRRLPVAAGDDVSHVNWTPDWDVAAKVGGGGEKNSRHRGLTVSKL
eukprot:SAG11_NODE_5766_length_1467_cov_1.391813_2_plen_167_part_00